MPVVPTGGTPVLRLVLVLFMIFAQPISFAEALESRAVRSLLPTDLSSAQLEEISNDLLERGMFSARVTSAEYLPAIADVRTVRTYGQHTIATAL